MPEREPGSAPKPRPPADHWDGPMKDVFARQPEAVAPEVAEITAVPVEAPQPELAAAVVDVEAETPPATEPVLTVEAPVTTLVVETPVVEAPAVTAATLGEFGGIEDLEAQFAAPSAEKEVVEQETSESPEAIIPTTPKRSETSHHEYHSQRPAVGIYRSGTSFKRTAGTPQGGKFASKAEYEEQIGANDPTRATKHYDEVTGLNETQAEISERPSYETMKVDQLVSEYAKADVLGDKFVTDEIFKIYETKFMEEVTRPGTTMTEEDYNAALEQFSTLTAIAVEQENLAAKYEKAKDSKVINFYESSVEEDAKEPSVGDKLKGFWKKGVESAKKLFRPGVLTEMWVVADQKLKDGAAWALNYGVDPEADDADEVERKRKRNRRYLTAGAAAVTVAALGVSFGMGFAAGSGGDHEAAAEALGPNGFTGGQMGGEDVLSAQDQSIADALTPNQASDFLQNPSAESVPDAPVPTLEEIPPVPEPAPIPEGYNISSGEGGEQLFNTLNIDTQKWYSNQESFLANFPNDFYRMPGGGVGISHQGMLSEPARNAIEALR